MPLRRLLSISLICLLFTPVFSKGADEANTQPNVIFVLCDDLGYGDYGVFFQDLRRRKGDRAEPWHLTPQIDAMASEGVQLRQHYCPAPVCAPSRASLLLGVHQGHSNVRDNQFDKALEDNHTLGTVMQGAGYATAAIGKWGLQGGPSRQEREALEKSGQSVSPKDWPGYPTKRGFDDFYGYVRHRDGHAHYPNEDGKEVWENDREVSSDLAGCYTADLFTARAKKWIIDQRSEQPETPFFVYLAFDTPHAKLQLPAAPYPEGGGIDGGLQWTGEPGRMINTADGVPDTYLHPDYAEQTWDHDDDAKTPEQPWPDVYKRYAADVRRIDDCLGDLLKLLEDLSIDDETLVVFTTDNGPSRESYLPERYEPTFFHSFGPFDGIKRDAWEGGIRVGAVARWPGTAEGNRISEVPSQFHDWMPTFCELAGVPAPARCDGTSLAPMLTGQGTQATSQIYVEYFNGQRTPGYSDFEESRRGGARKQMQAIRLGDLVGVRYHVQSHADPFKIYNVVEDPKQTKDLAAQHPDIQQQMHDQVLRMRRPNESAKRPYDDEPVPAVSDSGSKSGVAWQVYEANSPWLARLDDLSAKDSGEAKSIEDCPQIQPNESQLITALIEVPTDGKYTFSLPAGVTAVLRLHDATVLDAGFAASQEQLDGEISLAAGKHPLRLYWQGSGAVPQVGLSGPGLDSSTLDAKLLYQQ
ncbi:sulfatase-like hydrolase/transferase [Allorhodopirellula solitaria]|uniref:Arylsulfatase n=1 Tax=Allorhodopirellula solitaria TaxID=2527987 RepID=A0A5C5XTK1_9BACT|nr:sulfatase-like hydrolase/transferase [Allorhodopirellula solitaria]TWT66204.1 Arylsulfatase precursor [Allorhodopirellula solitaria]